MLRIRNFPRRRSGATPTTARRAQAMLEDVVAHFRSGDAVFVFGGDLRIRAWNEAAERLTGIPAHEAIGRFCWEVLCARDAHGSVVCHAGCSNARLMREGWPVGAQRLTIRTAGGRRDVTVSTLAALNGDEPLFLHLMRNGEERPVEEPAEPPARLTPRQLEVLQLAAEGKPAKVIARELGIAEVTVRNHIRMILLELSCHSQLAAVAEARRRRLLRA